MIFLPIFILAFIQGITEFLPVSSSGHLVLVHSLFGDDFSLSAELQKIMDIAVHVGTLFAVMLYFRKDLQSLVFGGFSLILFRWKNPNSIMALKVIVASIPVIIVGLIVFKVDVTIFDSLSLMAWMSIIFGGVLFFADRKAQSEAIVEDFTWRQAIIYGLAQCLALVPGVSRSGITMTAGRFLGHNRTQAARFSLLLGMVAIAGAGTLTGFSLVSDVQVTREFLSILAVGVAVSFVTAYVAIVVMMRWISSSSFTPFVVYRIVLGCVLLGLLYSGVIPQDM